MTDDFLARIEERKKARREADRSFVLLGETLAVRPSVTREVGADLMAARDARVTAIQALQKLLGKDGQMPANADDAQLGAVVEATRLVGAADDTAIQVAEETIIDCLEPGTHEAWARLRAKDAADPLTAEEMEEIAEYLLGKIAEIPTSAPSVSSDGRTETSSKSRANSSSRGKIPVGSH